MKTSLLKNIKPTILLLTAIITFISCDKDFVTVESDIRGIQNFNTASKLFPFKAYNKKTEALQTNGLPNYVLGIYNDPNYGSTSASIVTQLVPESLTPDFTDITDNSEILSVRLYIPYFSTLQAVDIDGNSTYLLDSVFGSIADTYKLSVYQNNYFLRDSDPETDFEDPQAYYSSSYQDLGLTAFQGQMLYENDTFTPSLNEIVTVETTGDTEETVRKVPGLWLNLNNPSLVPVDYWSNLLFLPENNEYLTSATAFKNFFRGLIIKAESNDLDGNMLMLNLINNSIVEIRYNPDSTNAESDDNTYTLNLGGITFNTLENLSNFPVLTDGDQINGDDQLKIKGFEGSMSVIELFDGTILDENNMPQDALLYFKNKDGKWLINEANLNFYVDHTAIQGQPTSEPDRLLLVDLETNTPIIDYYFDTTEDLTDPINSKIIHTPALLRDADGKGIKYKFRLTEHINRILQGDSENVKLGLYVSTNVNLVGTSNIKNTTEDDTVNAAPQSSVIAPKGTILYGNTTSVPENSKATFEIFYTESQN